MTEQCLLGTRKMISFLKLSVFFVAFIPSFSKIIVDHEIKENRSPVAASINERHEIQKVYKRFKRDRSSDQRPEFMTSSFKDKKHNQAVLHWSGVNDSQVIFMLMRETDGFRVTSSELQRSTDYGDSFSPVPTRDRNAIVSSYYVSPINANMLLFADATSRTLYITEDEGENIERCGDTILPIIPERIKFSPYDKNSFLVYSYTNSSVLVTTDKCKTWHMLSNDIVTRVYWGVKGIDPENTIHMEVQDLASDGYRYRKFSPPFADAVGKDMVGVIDRGTLTVINKYIFVQKTSESTSKLHVSFNRLSFRLAYFPLDQQPLDMNIVSADESQVFIAANHKQGHVNLYLSDESGQFFTLSLSNVSAVQYYDGFSADLYEVKGLAGVYIANKYVANNHTKTYITFDQGGNWTQISKPLNSASKCKSDDCNLHLHLLTSQWMHQIPGPTSTVNAPGIIMAQGSVGAQLSDTSSSLYISHDGGLTWRFAHDGDFYHNIIDQGGALVATNITDPERKSNTVLLSVNEGVTWQTYNFSRTILEVNGVLNEPGTTTLRVSIFGHTAESGWIVITADFDPVLNTECNENDYEMWSPSDYNGHDCLLGRKLTYKRQKMNTVCKNGVDFSQSVTSTACNPCVEEDFECDYGFTRDTTGKCTALPWHEANELIGQCIVSKTYSKSSGYRKVASDGCVGGDLIQRYKGTTTVCPVLAPQELHLSLAGESIVGKGDTVTFELLQFEGSTINTTYKWQFEEGDVETLHYNKSRRVKHVYHTRGIKLVNVTATNHKGSVSTSLEIYVEEKIVRLAVTEPHGAMVGVPVPYKAHALLRNDEFDDKDASIHYVWNFNDFFELNSQPKVTWSGEITHTYSLAGNYTCVVQVFNAISSRFTKFHVAVYGILETVQLSFGDDIYLKTLSWDTEVAYSVKESVMELLGVDHTRLEVVAFTSDEDNWLVDVSILPKRQNIYYDPTIQELANKLVKSVNEHSLRIDLNRNVYGNEHIITATGAVMLDLSGPSAHGSKEKLRTALYVCVPIACVVIILIIPLIILHYKRKARTLNNRYRLLRSHSQRPDDTGNSLLDENDHVLDDDDDDPLIDPSHGPEPTLDRLVIGDE